MTVRLVFHQRSHSSGLLFAIGCRSGALQPRPRPALTSNESQQASQRRGWNSRQASDELSVFSIEGPLASNGSDGIRVPGFVLIVVSRLLTSARGLLRADVDGSKGRD